MRVVPILLPVLLLSTVPCAGAVSDEPVNYAFSHELGSGIYEINGRHVHLYRVSPIISVNRRGRTSWFLRIHSSLSFVDMLPQDVLNTSLPENLASIAVLPSLVLEREVTRHWRLAPFVGVGAGKDLATGALNWIYTLGVKNRLRFDRDPYVILLSNRFFYSGFTDKKLNFEDDYSAFHTGAGVRRTLGPVIRGARVDGGVFGASYVHLVSPRILTLPRSLLEMRSWWEVGVTLGTADPLKILGLRMPRLGVSYRFGEGTDAVRIVVGAPY